MKNKPQKQANNDAFATAKNDLKNSAPNDSRKQNSYSLSDDEKSRFNADFIQKYGVSKESVGKISKGIGHEKAANIGMPLLQKYAIDVQGANRELDEVDSNRKEDLDENAEILAGEEFGLLTECNKALVEMNDVLGRIKKKEDEEKDSESYHRQRVKSSSARGGSARGRKG